MAVAGGEKPVVVRSGNVIFTVNGNASPTALPRNKLAPISFHASGKIATADGTHPPALAEAVLDTGKAGTIEAGDFPTCRPGEIEARTTEAAERACRDAIVGGGQTEVEVQFPESSPFTAKGPLVIFNGGEKAGKSLMLIHAYVSVPAPTAIVTTVLTNGEHKGPYRLHSVAKIPSGRGRRGLGDQLLSEDRPQGVPDGQLQQRPFLRPPDRELPRRDIGLGELRAALHADRLSEVGDGRADPGRAVLPAKFALTQVGELVILTARTVGAAIAPPYPYGEELVGQFLFALRLSWFPLLISTVALSFGAPGLQAANFLTLIGALDRLGGFFVLAAIRQIAPLVTAVVVAGVAGTAITADLGARKIREELDALQVLGVDPIKNLVVPRVLALMVVTALLDIFALVFGIVGGILTELLYHQSLGGFFADPLFQRLDHRSLGLDPDVLDLRRDDRRRLRLQGDERLRRRGRRRPLGEPGRGDFLRGDRRDQLRVHGDAARHPPRTAEPALMERTGDSWLGVPREWLDSFGEIARFGGRVAGTVYSGRVFRFFGESLRQAGILILGSALIIWFFVFVFGLQCGILGAYLLRANGAPAYAGVFSAWCDLREIMPYAFGYMLAAKVGTGIVAELGAMRISDEIDAMEVMGIPPVTFLCATRLLAAWIALPFIYLVGIGVMFGASYISVVQQIGDVSSGGYELIFWMFQNPPDLIFSLIKGMFMATAIVLVGCYYGYTASGGPVGVGTATAKSMVLNIILVHIIGMLGTLIFWGSNPRAPIGG